MTPYGINRDNLRREARRRRIESHTSFWIILAGSYITIAFLVGVIALANQLLGGTR